MTFAGFQVLPLPADGSDGAALYYTDDTIYLPDALCVDGVAEWPRAVEMPEVYIHGYTDRDVEQVLAAWAAAVLRGESMRLDLTAEAIVERARARAFELEEEAQEDAADLWAYEQDHMPGRL